MLTARGEVADRVRGLDLGATDYLVKPFAFSELTARIRAHTRQPDRQRDAQTLEVGELALDLLTREARIDGRDVTLSAREFALLAFLMRHPGQVLSRQQILNGVWGYTFDPRSNLVDVYIGYLRRKLGDGDSVPDRDGARDGVPAGGEEGGMRNRLSIRTRFALMSAAAGGRRAGLPACSRSTRSNGARWSRTCAPTRATRPSTCPPPGSATALPTTAHRRARPNPATTAESRDRAPAPPRAERVRRRRSAPT